jgi:excisionase family DNA binding protein
MAQGDLLTASAAGALLGVHEETIRAWAKEGLIRHIVLPSGQRRYRRADIDAILEPVEPTEATA